MKNNDLEQLRTAYREIHGECVPVIPKLYYSGMDKVLIRRACLEYWERHNFSWHSYVFPQLSFTPTVAKGFLLRDYPADMACALSTAAFKDLYESTLLTIDDGEAEMTMRRFCLVVCGIGRAMQQISEDVSPTLLAKLPPKILLDLALVLIECEKD